MKRSLLLKLVLPLGVLVGLFTLSLVSTLVVTSGQDKDGMVINLAGRGCFPRVSPRPLWPMDYPGIANTGRRLCPPYPSLRRPTAP